MVLTRTDEGAGCGEHPLLEIRPLSSAAGLSLRGEIDLTNRHELTAALEPFVDVGADFCLELSGLSFIDVGGMTVLNGVAERLAPERLVLWHPPGLVRRGAPWGWDLSANVELVDS